MADVLKTETALETTYRLLGQPVGKTLTAKVHKTTNGSLKFDIEVELPQGDPSWMTWQAWMAAAEQGVTIVLG